MPSISTYTPLESLLFFQSVASLGATTSAFTKISESLTKNDFIRRDESYSGARLSPKALQEFYDNLLREEAKRQTGVNGFVEGSENSRKRKLSSPPRLSPTQAVKDPQFWSTLIDRLYAQYRDHAVEIIHGEEKKFDDIKGRLSEQQRNDGAALDTIDTSNIEATTLAAGEARQRLSHAGEVKVSDASEDGQTGRVDPTTVPSSRSETPAGQLQNGTAAQRIQGAQTPASTARTSRSITTPKSSHPVDQSASPAGPQQPVMLPPTASPLRPAANITGSSAAGTQAGIHYPPGTSMYSYPPSQGYPQPWSQNLPRQQQNAMHAPNYVHSPPMQQDFSGRTPIMTQTPQPQMSQAHYAPYQYHPAQLNGMQPLMQHPGMAGPGGPVPWPTQSTHAASTPVSNANMPNAAHMKGSFGGRSPWKSTPSSAKSEMPRPRSREVSPIPERLTASAKQPRKVPMDSRDTHKDQLSMRKPDRPSRRNRGGSASPSTAADRSRSESIMSQTSDARPEQHRIRRHIKNETPGTPLPLIPSDSIETEQGRSSTRRRRGNTVQSQSQPRVSTKRKRGESTEGADGEEASETPRPSMPAPVRPVVDQDKVYATRNFARICGPIMNDVTAHKHAGLFAKPLTERDAPGYRSLIFRPSDLKTIKSMIHAGSRAVNAALEDAASGSTPAEGGTASPAVNTPTSSGTKNSAILLDKSVDLIPPKAIVNSAQLEKELMRMFANAAMFNPMPKSERGFGPDVHLTEGGLDAAEAEEEGIEFKGYSNEEDSGNIIRDTREMMDTVEEAVRVWRDAEQTSISFGEEFAPFMNPRESTSGLRGVSLSETVGEDSMMDPEEADVDTPGPGTSRKRRRMAET